jgi:hypothetical protein
MNQQPLSGQSQTKTVIKRRMRDVHYLYPDVIYRFNALFQHIWDNHNLRSSTESGLEKDCFVIPAFFSKSSRTFHWFGIGSSMWKWDDPDHGDTCKRHLVALLVDLHDWVYKSTFDEKEQVETKWKQLALTSRETAWEQLLDDLPPMGAYTEAKTVVADILRNPAHPTLDSIKDWEKVHRALLAIYSGYHQSAYKNIEGIFYRFFEQYKPSHTYQKPDYLTGELHDKPPFDWLELDSVCGLNRWQSVHNPDVSFESKPPASNSNGRTPLQQLAEDIFLKHLLLEPNAFGAELIKRRQMALLPLHDLSIRGTGYGGIKAVLAAFFKEGKNDKNSVRDTWLKKFPKLNDAFDKLAEEVTVSAEALATAHPITPPYDLVRLYLEALIHVQDWESAAVFDGTEFQYGYKRRKAKARKSHKWTWDFSSKPDDFRHKHLRPSPSEPIQRIRSSIYMWWTADDPSLWTKELIVGIADDEINRFGRISIRYQFPIAVHIPTEKADQRVLRDDYLGRQLDLMQTLIPRVKARRSALRNAAVSIMARNMSHNIGSHVLVAAQREIATAVDGEKAELLRQLGKLQQHLQSRMDFIAEMATVESFYSPVHDLFAEVLGFNVMRESETLSIKSSIPIKEEERLGFVAQDLLLKHISGDENLTAHLSLIGSARDHHDVQFSCPGGTLGWQAFYVILENIIRNVAKHSNALLPEKHKVHINIRVVDAANDDFDDFWEVRVWDTCKSAFQMNNDQFLVHHINEDFFDEKKLTPRYPKLIDADGRLERGRWGLREMYICAAYLREISLSDLESVRPVDEPPVVLKAIAVDDLGNLEEQPTNISDAGSNAHLGYCFYLAKPKLLAIVADDDDSLHVELDVRRQALAGQGITVMTRKYFEQSYLAIGRSIRHRDVVSLCERPFFASTSTVKQRTEAQTIGLLPRQCLHRELFSFDEWNQFANNLRGGLLQGNAKDALKLVRFELLKWMGSDRGVGSDKLKVYFLNLQQSRRASIEADTTKAAVFDYHGYIEQDGDGVGFFANRTNATDWASKLAFYERYPTVSSQKVLFHNLVNGWSNNSENECIERMEFQYAAACGVIILDERIQRAGEDEAPEGYRSSDAGISKIYRRVWWLERMRIFVPRKTRPNLEQNEPIDLEKPDSEAILGWVQRQFKKTTDTFGIGYLIIHQGIIDKLEDSEIFKKTLLDLLNKYRCTLVLCSGRGVPPQGYQQQHANFWPRFVPVSALLERVINSPSKYHLIRLLEGSRVPNT